MDGGLTLPRPPIFGPNSSRALGHKSSKGLIISREMICVETLTLLSPPSVMRSARALFLAYRDFLRNIGVHEGFNYDRLEQEAFDLPAAYAAANGEVLVAVFEEVSLGCIAYRKLADCAEEDCCEIKRLFVLPEHRARGIGRSLIMAALDHARARGYRFAYLDTEPGTMSVAHHTYLKLGFVEYDSRPLAAGVLSFLRAPLM